METSIRTKLCNALAPDLFELVDESALHAGHAGARPGGQTHFRLKIVSKHFEGLTRVARQRMVYGLLEAEFVAGLHALALRTFTPDEARKSL